jgi:hypothetical protein
MLKRFNDYIFCNEHVINRNIVVDPFTGEVYNIPDAHMKNLINNYIIYIDDKNDVYRFNTKNSIMINKIMFLVNNNISNIYINEDEEFDVYEDVILSNKELYTIPIPFNDVWGNFDISKNFITKLKNCPVNIYGSFDASNNFLNDLYGSPEHVQDDFIVSRNFIKSFEGGPKEVGGTIDVSNTAINSLSSFGGHFDIIYLPNSSITMDEIDEYYGNLYISGFVDDLKLIEDKISIDKYNELKNYVT